MDGQAKAVAWLRTWMSSLRGSIRSISTTPLRWLCSSSIRRAVSAASSGVSAAPRQRTSWTSAGSFAAARSRYGTPFCRVFRPTKTTLGRSGSMPSARMASSFSSRVHMLDVDAVVDHPDLGRVDVRVAAQDVLPHALRDGDDGGCGLVGGLLHPGGQGVAAAELLGLPRPQRLKAVGAEDVRDAVQQRRQVAGHVGIPGVRVDQVRAGDVGHDPQVHAEGLDGGVRAAQVLGRGV